MNWKDKNVVVTGSSGVIGSVLVNRLVELGARVLSIDIASGEGLGTSVEHIQVDLSKEIPRRITDFDPEIVFHLAATFERTDEEPDYWKTSFKNNTLLSHELLSVISQCNSLKLIIFASSYLIYNPSIYLNSESIRSLKESDSISPRNLVGLGKYYTERELDFIQKTSTQIHAVSARIFRVYGRGSRDVISRWIRSALKGETIEVYGRDGFFDYIYADDVAEGLVRISQADASQGMVNLGTGVARSVGDIVSILQSEFPGLQVRELDRESTKEGSCADMTRFKQLTGWAPSTSLNEGIRQVIDFEKRRRAQ
jgi:nucleoside-diphosphate-sugar epimerase